MDRHPGVFHGTPLASQPLNIGALQPPFYLWVQ